MLSYLTTRQTPWHPALMTEEINKEEILRNYRDRVALRITQLEQHKSGFKSDYIERAVVANYISLLDEIENNTDIDTQPYRFVPDDYPRNQQFKQMIPKAIFRTKISELYLAMGGTSPFNPDYDLLVERLDNLEKAFLELSQIVAEPTGPIKPEMGIRSNSTA